MKGLHHRDAWRCASPGHPPCDTLDDQQQVKNEISRENTMIDTFVREQMGLEVGTALGKAAALGTRE